MDLTALKAAQALLEQAQAKFAQFVADQSSAQPSSGITQEQMDAAVAAARAEEQQNAKAALDALKAKLAADLA